ncbi:MAG TPA: hypothetical protein VHW90_03435 [Stellaceae bacterium]|jgi:hypothetical protein|nr:hypothetical protein [Stellaceae bacterium]
MAGAAAHAADAPPVLPGQLAGNTLSAVAYVPRPAGEGGGELQRIMLQAYLAADGSTVVRQWLPARNSYSPPAQTSWSLSQNRLCIDMPATTQAARPLCAVVHIWGPRIAGIGTQPYAMLDGDLQPGNVIGARPRH